MIRVSILFAIVLSTAVGSYCRCAEPEGLRGDSQGVNHPLSSSEPDNRPRMRFDTAKAYRLEFGRGSGWHGLDTVAIQDGKAVLYRLKRDTKKDAINFYWVTGTIHLPKAATEKIAKSIDDLALLDFQRAYHADVHDGTQWVFWLVQEKREKSVYFNNHFPKAIQDFAVALDEQLKEAGADKIKWTRVPSEKSRQHEKAIWGSIRDKPN